MDKAEQSRYIKLIRESRPLEPLPVDLPPEWEALIPGAGFLKKIKAVLFDVYGTLFVSGAGEIAAAEGDAAVDGAAAPELPEMRDYFRRAVRHYHEKARAPETVGNAWPEVAVDEIWALYEGNVPAAWEIPRQFFGGETGPGITLRESGRELALRYELAVNPVYPMPNAQEALKALASGGLKLGIISNAQFYTPLLFNAFFNAPPEELGFDPALLIYSYKEKEAKPSPRLFVKARELLASEGIKPEETLYMGNDMRNDINPAAAAGFKTALFAGDRRSLRLRDEKTKPDMVVKNLKFFQS